MSAAEIIILAIGLSTDAFAVSICKGLSSRGSFIKTGLACGVWFGFFQALMPFLGWLLGSTVSRYIESVAPYIAFGLLAFLGIKMIAGAMREHAKENSLRAQGITDIPPEADSGIGARVMFSFAIATSIDALAVGIAFAVKGANIIFAAPAIAIITFILSGVGLLVGNLFGSKYKNRAEFVGGLILILMGLKSLLDADGLGIINF